MKKITFLILFSSLLLCSSKAVMADTDIIQLSDTTHSYAGGNVGTGPESKDGNFSSYYGFSVGGTGGSAIASTHTFAQAHLINRIDFKFYAHGREYGDDTGYLVIDRYVNWYNGSTWALVPGSNYYHSESHYHDGYDAFDDVGPVTLTGLNLVNCSAIEAYVYVVAYNNKNSNANAQAYIYEIQAWAPVATPVVSTLDAFNITSAWATLKGNITNTGGENVVERGFDWGTSSGSYPNSWTESSNFGTGAFSHQITGLNQQTPYYFRAKARNSIGWGYGSEKSFTTLECVVNLKFFAHFASHWLDGPCDETNNWCDGADLNHVNDVDMADLMLLVNEWLKYCPQGW